MGIPAPVPLCPLKILDLGSNSGRRGRKPAMARPASVEVGER
jgi:hypothetical protein